MKKIFKTNKNKFLSSMIALCFCFTFFAELKAQQDKFKDLDRSNWQVSSRQGNGSAFATDGTVGGQPENILVDNNMCLVLNKPGRNDMPVCANPPEPCTVLPYFTVIMDGPQTVNYFRWRHRRDNNYNRLKTFAVHIYVSEDGLDFEQLVPETPEAPNHPNLFWIPVNGGYVGDLVLSDGNNYYYIDIPESTFQFMKVEIVVWTQNYGTTLHGTETVMYQHPDWPGEGTTAYGNSAQLSEFGLGFVVKEDGAEVNTPEIDAVRGLSLSIKPLQTPSTGQIVEYAISDTNSVPEEGWQRNLSFYGLDAGTTYYIFARAKLSPGFRAGPASEPLIVSTLDIAQLPVILTEDNLPKGNVNANYSVTLEGDGEFPLSWELKEGSELPLGLELRDNGVISGTPSVRGSKTFTIILSNDVGTVEKEYTIIVEKELVRLDKPTLLEQGESSITVSPLDIPASLQEIEYAITTFNEPPQTGWSDSFFFDDLKLNTVYYIFARAVENDDYGTAYSPSLRVQFGLGNDFFPVDFDRLEWTVTSLNHPDGSTHNIDGSNGAVEHILTTAGTYLSMTKPGRSAVLAPEGGVAKMVPADFIPYFIVDMKSPQKFNYFKWQHRNFNYGQLRVFAVKLYGSADGENFTTIMPELPEAPKYPEWFWIPNVQGYDFNANSAMVDDNIYVINTPEMECRYVKVELVMECRQYRNHHPSYFRAEGAAGGDNMQVRQFALGRLFTPEDYVAPQITTTELPDGTAGETYNQTLTSTAIPYATWSVEEGALPNGLTLRAADGVISGRPIKKGIFSFTVKALNNLGEDFKVLSIEIHKGTSVSVSTPTLRQLNFKSIEVNTVVASNGQEVEYSINTENVVPATGWQIATTFSALTAETTYYIFARGKGTEDFEEGQASEPLVVTTLDAPVAPKITTAALPSVTVLQEYSVTIVADGDEPISWEIGDLPNGLEAEENTISGTPTIGGTFTVTVKAINEGGEDTKDFVLSVEKLAGFNVAAPTLAENKGTSIIITKVETSNGQEVEYAINAQMPVPPTSGWQSELTFSNLTVNTKYFVFARAKENNVYKQGAISQLEITTIALTSSGELLRPNPLKIWTANGKLRVTGLTEGKTWSVYSVSGTLIYRGVATGTEADIALPVSGVYIIQSENNALKFVLP